MSQELLAAFLADWGIAGGEKHEFVRFLRDTGVCDEPLTEDALFAAGVQFFGVTCEGGACALPSMGGG